MTTVTFTLAARNTPFHDEFGLFLVDDSSGQIGKLKPGERGYTAAALSAREVVFTRNQSAGADVALQLPAGRYFGTYLIQNGTSKEFLARNPENVCKTLQGPLLVPRSQSAPQHPGHPGGTEPVRMG